MTEQTAVAEGQQTIDRWVTFCSGLLAETPANFVPLKKSLAAMTDWADDIYPEFSDGATVSFEAYGHLPLETEVARQFVDLTGDVLFTGIDGPRNTGAVLQRALGELVAEIARGHAPAEWRNEA